MDKRVIRGIYLYEFKLGTTAKETDEKIDAAFGQGCSTIRTAYRWYQKFPNGDESLEEHEGRGRHSDGDENKLRDVVEEDPHKGTREIAKVLGVSHNTAARHLKEIGKTKKLERWVPHELSEEQRNRRYEISLPLCLTFIDLKKAFDSVETEALIEALLTQGVPTQYIGVLRELYSEFTTKISPFYNDVVIDVRREVQQGDTISPKLFSATLSHTKAG
ncbi:unnamed protein product [Heligmosomoides polygyrus]|uniref:HTH_48 domain-containing protein n=1 Tax=Heligmosomoides polygyrus TaxID=6339 RepID=A0A3P7WMM7_HELPZ|nr:unnamed protein product [Heligmosomoides polygyrus]